MRLAVLSDLHGNLPALEAVLHDIETHGPFDALGVAGDLCQGGPHPRQVLRRVRTLNCPVVQGNHDRYLTIADPAELLALGKGVHARAMIAWARAQLDADDLAYLAALPTAYTYSGPERQDVLMVHANARDQERLLSPYDAPAQIAALLPGVSAAVVVFGHLHAPYIRTIGASAWPADSGRHEPLLLVNAASVGYPRDDDQRAAYAILEWQGSWLAHIQRVSYDLAATTAAIAASDMPDPRRRIHALLAATYAKRPR